METNTSRGNVLVVDDDPGIRSLIKDKLSRDRFTCTNCSNGAEALDALDRQAFDIIISDLQMPGISGLELLRLTHERHNRAAFLMITGVDDIRVVSMP